MVEINSSSSGLQAQLQAQLQAGSGRRAGKNSLDLTPRPSDVINERIKDRAEESRRSEADRQAPAQRTSRSNELSSSRELAVAQQKVSQLSANNREAPIGRTSTQAASNRNIPLGQIIDIRV